MNSSGIDSPIPSLKLVLVKSREESVDIHRKEVLVEVEDAADAAAMRRPLRSSVDLIIVVVSEL